MLKLITQIPWLRIRIILLKKYVSAHNMLHERQEQEMILGWVDYPEKYDKDEIERIINAAERIKDSSEVFHNRNRGSYLGARAAVEIGAFIS